jgi:hypothetical protein
LIAKIGIIRRKYDSLASSVKLTNKQNSPHGSQAETVWPLEECETTTVRSAPNVRGISVERF